MKGYYVNMPIKTIKQWLETHARNEYDLEKDKKGYFVYMGSGNKQIDSDLVKVYLPKWLK